MKLTIEKLWWVQGMAGAVGGWVVGLWLVLLFVHRRDVFFFAAVGGWVVMIGAILLITIFASTRFFPSSIRLVLAIAVFVVGTALTIALTLKAINIRQKIVLDARGRTTTAHIYEKFVNACPLCDYQLYVRYHFTTQMGDTIHYLQKCPWCIYYDSVRVVYDPRDPHLNQLLPP